MKDSLYKLIEKDFKKNGISSVCYLMRKFKINSYMSHQYITKLSHIAYSFECDKNNKIVMVLMNGKIGC